MRHLVAGTAGHIDHGKSALVRALTGIDPDRLAEEQRRGITIELGFADLDLGGDRLLSFVDVPGHERFVRQMVAGATGIDAVVLVVAADQGVQPQTREHLQICRLLDVGTGIVALTKCDLAEPELREVVELELRELLAGTFLERAPIVPVSARTGAGLDRLREELSALFDRRAARPTDGVARLPVDRSFVLRGFGTVVTGTLVSGALAEGEEIEVLPGARRGRIRGLQVHGRTIERAVAGQRAAVNLQGLDCAMVPRGATLTRPGELRTTRRLLARVQWLEHAPEALRRRGGPVRFHQGTCDRAARLRVLGASPVGPARAELVFDGETVVALGDRFILRRPAPVDTVGGGQVLDARPPRGPEVRTFPMTEDVLRPSRALGLRLARHGVRGVPPDDLAPELGLPRRALDAVVEQQEVEGTLVRAAGRVVDAAAWQAARARTLDALDAFHAAQPLRGGVSREELRALAARAMPQELWRVLLERLAAERVVGLQGEQVARAGHRVVLVGADFDLARRIEQRFRDAGLDPPAVEVALAGTDPASAPSIVERLIAEGTLVRIQDGRLFHGAALAELRQRVLAYAATSRTIDVAAFKDLAGVTRKNAIPLLEQLDAERITRRRGNLREIVGTTG